MTFVSVLFSRLKSNSNRRHTASDRHLRFEALEQRRVLATFGVSPGDSIQDAIDAAILNPGPDEVAIEGLYRSHKLTQVCSSKWTHVAHSM